MVGDAFSERLKYFSVGCIKSRLVGFFYQVGLQCGFVCDIAARCVLMIFNGEDYTDCAKWCNSRCNRFIRNLKKNVKKIIIKMHSSQPAISATHHSHFLRTFYFFLARCNLDDFTSTLSKRPIAME